VSLLLIFGCAFIPTKCIIYVNFNNRIFIASLCIIGYFSIRKFTNHSKGILFGLYDVLFLCFILFTFASQLWARNPIDAISVSFSWLFYYCVFKFFQDWNLHSAHKKFFSIFLQILLCYNLIIVFFYFFYKGFSIENFTLQFANQQINELGIILKLHKNYMAIYLATLCGIPIYYLLYMKQKFNVLGVVIAISLCVSLLLIRSRGGIFIFSSLLILHAIYAIWRKKRQWFILPVILILAYTCFEFVSSFQQNEKNYLFLLDPLYGVKNDTGDDRLNLWKITFQLFLEKPILGHGSGSWIYEYMKYGVGDLYAIDFTKTYFKTTHNVFLNILFCNGILGLCLFLVLVVWYPLFTSLKNSYDSKIDMNSKICQIGLFAILLIMLFYGGFDIRGGVLLGGPLMLFIFLGILIKEDKVLTKTLPFFLIIASCLSSIFYYQNVNSNQQKQRSFFQQLKKENYEDCKVIIKDLEDSWVGYSHIGNTTDYLNFQLMEKMKCRNEAIKSLEIQLKKDPYNFNHWYDLGLENQRLRFLDKAVSCFENALLYNCDFIQAKVRLYFAHTALGDAKQALLYKNELHEIDEFLMLYKANEAIWENIPKAVRKNRHYLIQASQIKKFHKTRASMQTFELL